jgi:hypothetical protein
MVLNQSRITDVALIVADGLFEVARTIVELAAERAPDSPTPTPAFPYGAGEGLPRQGGVLVYVENKKTHGWSLRGDQPKKPRAVRESTKAHAIVAIAGFGFPARFNERGTINQPARPFLAPVRDQVEGHVAEMVGEVTRPKLAAAH